RAGTDLGGHALDVIAGRALQMESGLAGIFGVVENRRDGRRSAFLCSTGRFHRVGKQTVANVSRRRIHFEAGANGLCPSSVVAHELDEAICNLLPNTAVD